MPDSVQSSIPKSQNPKADPIHPLPTKRPAIEEGIYRITTQPIDDNCDRKDRLHLSIDSGFVKVFPETRDDASLWRITRAYTGLDTFNINSPSTGTLPHPDSKPKYRIENVGSREFLSLSQSRLTLVATKGFDNPLEVFISPSPSSACDDYESTPSLGYKMYTILSDEAWGKPEEFYLHVGIWQLTPEGTPVVPAPVHLASKVFPESDCSWGLEFVEGL